VRDITPSHLECQGEWPSRVTAFTIFIDSPVKHAFSFTPAVSLFVDCTTRDELESAFSTLSSGGQVLMPLDNYGFSTRFGWCADRFGVSWQLNFQ
jgi:predicted 3-demethylubiquinone-9 3-methyltransferase (glyoxalase superfamily)